jgi:succinate-semialdehyde dehydrogenase / glutarate-semialdehyde dehydrogenase
MITRKAGPAIAAGCTTVVKPSDLTPLSAIALQNLALRAGIDSGVFQLVLADAEMTPQVGTTFCTHPHVKKISFTGSTRVGKLLLEQAAGTVKRTSMELGGNACFVVFNDADIDVAVNAAMASKFRNAGQTCVSSDRFLIQSGVYDEFVDKLTTRIDNLVLGPGIDPTTDVGPLITSKAVGTVEQKVQEAISLGAKCVTRGGARGGMQKATELGPNFSPPTLLTDVPVDCSLWKDETFGPVVAVRAFQTEEEALLIANDVDVGLASYFCTRDLSRAFRFAHKLEVGMVGVNEGIISNAVAPFGGVKESGVGREGSPLGLAEYLETKYIFMNT